MMRLHCGRSGWRRTQGGRAEGRLLTVLACLLALALTWPGGAYAGPEEGAQPEGPTPVKEEGEDGEKGDGEKGDGEKGDAEEDTGPKPAFWKASEAEALRVRGISCLRIHPKERDTLWAHVHGLGPATSRDGGRTWKLRLAGVDEDHRPGVRSQVRISLDPDDAKTLYLTIDGQIHHSENGGERWTNITSGALASLSWDQFKSTHLSWEVIVDPKKSVHLLVGTRNDGDHNGGLYESTNGGKSWAEIAGSAQSETGLGADTLFVRLNPSSDKYVTVAGRRGVWYSDSRGREFARNDPGGLGIHDIRWLSDFAGKELYLADARGIWRSKDGGKRWDKKPVRAGNAVGVFGDSHNRKRIFAIFADRGIEVSEDGRKAKWAPYGGHFGAVPEDAEPPENDGYRDAIIRQVYVHPRDRKIVYLASPVTGLHVSNDGGKTFAPVTHPEDAKEGTVPPTFVPPMAHLAVHPTKEGSALALSESGLLFRRRGGTTWERLGPLGMTAVGLAPDTMPGHWFALGYTLAHSTDDGATWQSIWPPEALRKKLHPEERVVGIHRGAAGDDKEASGGLTILLERSGALMRTTDGGATWSEIRGPKLPSSETWASHLAVDPGNPDHIVIAGRSVREAWSPLDDNGGLWESWDGGKSWRSIIGTLAPDKKDDAATRKAKMNWNRACFLAIDPAAGLLVYGADRRGIFTHPIVEPKAKKAKPAPAWVEVTPPASATPRVAAMARSVGAEGRYVAQFLGQDGASAVVAIDSATLKALHAAVVAAGEAKEDPATARANHAWTVLATPAAGVRFTSLAFDPAGPNRLLATESAGPGGIHTHVDPVAEHAQAEAESAARAKAEAERKAAAKKAAEEAAKKQAVGPKRTPPEGMRAFTGGEDKSWRVWGVDTGKSTGQMMGHEQGVWCIALAPNETQVVTGSEDKTVRFWNAQNAKHLGTVTLEAQAHGLAFDDDSTFVYVAGGASNKVFQIQLADRTVKPLEGHKGAVLCVATSEDTSRAYSGGEGGLILGWDVAKGTPVLTIEVGAPVIALAVAPDGSRFFAATDDGRILAFDAAGKPAGSIAGLAVPAQGLALSGDRLYATAAQAVVAYDVATLKPATTHAAPEASRVTCLTVSSDGVWILAGDIGGGLWIWQRGWAEAYRARAKEHDGAVLGVAVTPEETPDPAAGGGKEAAPKGDAPKGDAPKGDAPKDAAPKDAGPKDDAAKEPAPEDAPAPKKAP